MSPDYGFFAERWSMAPREVDELAAGSPEAARWLPSICRAMEAMTETPARMNRQRFRRWLDKPAFTNGDILRWTFGFAVGGVLAHLAGWARTWDSVKIALAIGGAYLISSLAMAAFYALVRRGRT